MSSNESSQRSLWDDLPLDASESGVASSHPEQQSASSDEVLLAEVSQPDLLGPPASEADVVAEATIEAATEQRLAVQVPSSSADQHLSEEGRLVLQRHREVMRLCDFLMNLSAVGATLPPIAYSWAYKVCEEASRVGKSSLLKIAADQTKLHEVLFATCVFALSRDSAATLGPRGLMEELPGLMGWANRQDACARAQLLLNKRQIDLLRIERMPVGVVDCLSIVSRSL